MEKEHLVELTEQSIRLELNVGELYRMFSSAFPEDSDFWWQLHLEEKSHATLIRAARDSLIKRDQFPAHLVSDSITDLKKSNARLLELIARFKSQPTNRYEACRIAVDIEKESGELHFAQFMEQEASSPVESVFQQLNRGDKDHAKRITAHARSIGAID